MKSMQVIMPVKDSLNTAVEAIGCVCAVEGVSLTVYNDNSTPENTATLEQLSKEKSFRLVNLCDLTDHPSPNYRLVLQRAQEECVQSGQDLVIVESDVMVKSNTFERLQQEAQGEHVGMVAAVTVDEHGEINFPYNYAQKLKGPVVDTKKRFSFCCTLLTCDFLKSYSFQELDPTKSWYDVTISHKSVELGFRNLLLLDTPVLHKPHSSRPWKQLKYTHPLKYYWQKLTQHRDKI